MHSGCGHPGAIQESPNSTFLSSPLVSPWWVPHNPSPEEPGLAPDRLHLDGQGSWGPLNTAWCPPNKTSSTMSPSPTLSTPLSVKH